MEKGLIAPAITTAGVATGVAGGIAPRAAASAAGKFTAAKAGAAFAAVSG
ncbi:MAG: hypothetical protein HZA03_05150 [Nitrospinae bacterium]|nr:hypothetical protein [Nitrospinota bacterium]